MALRARRHSRPAAVLGAVAALALLAGVAATPFGRALEGLLSRREVPVDLSTENRLRSHLLRARVLTLQPPATLDPQPLADGTCPPITLAARRLRPAELPSSVAAPPEALASHGPVLSLWIDRCRLRWLRLNRYRRGRRYEVLGWVSLFEGGRLRFASPVGVRMHGWNSRVSAPFSYRLYFRRRYGEPRFAGHLLAPELVGDPSRLIVKRDHGAKDHSSPPWLYAEATALAIGRRLGARAPGIRPVRFVLNGAPPLEYSLVERLDADYLERSFGHDEFVTVRAKLSAADADVAPRDDEMRRLAAQPRPLAAADLAGRFDLPTLLDSLVSGWFSGTGDPLQDLMLRDRRGELAGGLWTWVLWDEDNSFDKRTAFQRFRPAGEYLPFLLRGDASVRRRVAAVIARRLLVEDPGFRAALLRRAVDALNHELTPEFLDGLVEWNRELARASGVADVAFVDHLAEYFRRRPEEMREHARQLLGAGPTHPVEVTAPPRTLTVDGYAAPPNYRGSYPQGLLVTAEVAAGARDRFLGWRLDGAPVAATAPRLAVVVERPLRIAADFRAPD